MIVPALLFPRTSIVMIPQHKDWEIYKQPELEMSFFFIKVKMFSVIFFLTVACVSEKQCLNNSTHLEPVHFLWLQSCCLDMKYHPAVSADPEVCVCLCVFVRTQVLLSICVSCVFVCVPICELTRPNLVEWGWIMCWSSPLVHPRDKCLSLSLCLTATLCKATLSSLLILLP